MSEGNSAAKAPAPAPGTTVSSPSSDAAATARSGVALAALVIGAKAAEISAEAADAERTLPAADRAATTGPRARRGASLARPTRRQRSDRVAVAEFAPSPATSSPATVAQTANGVAPVEETPLDTQSELRDWIKDNATLMSNASLLISISALALNLLPETGVLDPYIKALIFGAALLLLIELHHQWPEDLQLHMFRGTKLPENHSWRMTAFAFIMQVATLVFVVWATLTNPIILIPLTALGVVLAFRQWYFRRYRGILAKAFGIVALLAVLLLSELLMVVVWAVVTDEQITIEFWSEDRPELTIETGR